MNQHRYRGDSLSPDGKPLLTPDGKPNPYYPDDDLKEIVNMAIALPRPLLVKGKPGCGKTRLAEAVAHELGLPCLPWYVKSTSTAREGLYRIDMLRRLHDSQMPDRKDLRLTPYLQWGPLGEAIKQGSDAVDQPRETVLLIDEIDKADLDFPNDLLHELDRMEFTIDELDTLTEEEKAAGFRKTYRAGPAYRPIPILIVTSNDEKELPEAFLRRCLFHEIPFPDRESLCKIVNGLTGYLKLADGLVQQAVEQFLKLRDVGEGVRKQPSPSELLDWVQILNLWEIPVQELQKTLLTEIPHWQKLYKHEKDIEKVKQACAPRS